MRMVWSVPIWYLVCELVIAGGSFLNRYPASRTIRAASEGSDDVGEPLFLTPYIESGQLEEGRKLSSVPPLLDNIASFSGYFTVNKATGSNIFLWFFPCETDPQNAPLAVWLQGGPGASSMYAIFEENGPYKLLGNLTIGRKQHYWTQKMSVIYIDQPVGTGFSFTTKDEGYPNNEDEVGNALYDVLQQFFTLFPDYRRNDFFVIGESYAGKFVPALSYAIHKNNPSAKNQMNLKGLAIGNGWVDPLNMIDYANLLFVWGFIDIPTRNRFLDIEKKIKNLIVKKEYHKAFWALDKYFDGDFSPSTLVQNITGINFYFNILYAQKNDTDDELIKYLNQPKVRRAIHVGKLTFYDDNNEVEKHLLVDELLSIAPKLEVLIDNYRVLLYNGQLDLICAYPLTANYVSKMNWKGKDEYEQATRHKWFVGTELAGYVKTAGNFSTVLVRNAGHMVPADQPAWALDLISKFTRNEPLKIVQ